MKLAIINNATNIVENIAVPPQGSNVWFCGEGYNAVLSETAKLGDIWDGENFTSPPEPEPEQE